MNPTKPKPKRRVVYQVGKAENPTIYRRNELGENYFFGLSTKTWYRSCNDNLMSDCKTIPASRARKLFPEAFKKGVKLP